MISPWLGFFVSLGAVVVVQLVGGYVTSKSVRTWYRDLAKPPFNPPGWVFGPVWTLLYFSMAVGAWMVWRIHGFRLGDSAWILYIAQLGLNLLWSVLFFGLRRPGLAFGEILALNVAILLTILSFWKLSPWAAGILIPYWIWVSFAGVLNVHLWRLNR